MENILQGSRQERFHLTTNWFDKNIPNWNKFLEPLKKKKITVLEIGAFEGACTTWILEELLLHPDSNLVTVDNFLGSKEHKECPLLSKKLDDLEQKFLYNIEKTNKTNQISVIKEYSYDALVKLNYEKNYFFNLIYIDGSHIAQNVLGDALLAWPLLLKQGILIFDDYSWDQYPETYNNPRLAIDAFLACYEPELEVIHTGYQIIVRKK